MSMLRNNEYRALALFGDKKEHFAWDIISLGVYITRTNQKTFVDRYLKKFLEYNWIRMVRRDPKQNDALHVYILTDKGDALLREESVARGGSPSHFKNFDRTISEPTIQTGADIHV